MIGQVNNIKIINKLIEKGKLPHFILLVGNKHTGKKYFSKYICKLIGYPYLECDSSFDDLREKMNRIYSINHEEILLLNDLDEYNFRCIDSLLKLTEEPPKVGYIIASIKGVNFLKNTLINRAFVLKMEPYYIHELKSIDSDVNLELLDTPSLIKLYKSQINSYIEFVDKFVRVIPKVEAGNSFKSVQFIEVNKESIDKIPLELLFKLLLYKIKVYYKDKPKLLINLTKIISKYKNELRLNSVNKNFLYLDFLISYRKEVKLYDFNELNG